MATHADQTVPRRRFEAFLAFLPRGVDGCRLRQVLDVRHDSFAASAKLALMRRHGCVMVRPGCLTFSSIADAEDGIVCLRPARSMVDTKNGYLPAAHDRWAAGARAGAGGTQPHKLSAYFIHGAKERAPAAAMALLACLKAWPLQRCITRHRFTQTDTPAGRPERIELKC